MKTAAVFLLVPLFSTVVIAAGTPNIVYIICDDLGYGDVHCLAPATSKIPTPHADRLAKEGMVFIDAHSGSSVCSPTRYGVLTGRYSWRTRLQRGVVQGFAPSLIASPRVRRVLERAPMNPTTAPTNTARTPIIAVHNGSIVPAFLREIQTCRASRLGTHTDGTELSQTLFFVPSLLCISSTVLKFQCDYQCVLVAHST